MNRQAFDTPSRTRSHGEVASPRKSQGDLFERTRSAGISNPSLRGIINSVEAATDYSLAGAAKAASLSEDTLRRAIARGDLDATIEAARGQEVYRISREALSLYLLFRGLPRRRQNEVREKRSANALGQRREAADKGASPIHLQLRDRAAGRNIDEAVASTLERPTSLMRVGGRPFVSPQSTLSPRVHRAADTRLSRRPGGQDDARFYLGLLEEKLSRLEAESQDVRALVLQLKANLGLE